MTETSVAQTVLAESKGTSSAESSTSWACITLQGALRKIGVPVLVIEEADGSWSIITPSLPGACAQGADVFEARAAIAEVLKDALDSARGAGRGIPFRHPYDDDMPAGRQEIVWLDA